MMDAPLLQVQDLVTRFYTDDGVVHAVDGVTFEVLPGETLGIVGESGCGKSVTSLSIMGLIRFPPGKIEDGSVWFGGRDLLKLPEAKMQRVRGKEISMIFQEPMTSLNPVFTIGEQIREVVELHDGLNRKDAAVRSIEMLEKVGIPDAKQRYREYPHQMSGGMRQRVMIAMALACNPRLLIADEPTTALDVTIQAQILDLIKDLKDRTGTSVMLITHDLGVVAEVCSRVVVMYAGRIVESADVANIFSGPKHPYTWGLVNSVPKLARVDRLLTIEGTVPDATTMPQGCKFHPRCRFADDRCRTHEPPIEDLPNGHSVRCWRHAEITLSMQESAS